MNCPEILCSRGRSHADVLNRAPRLVTGETEGVLIDGGFTLEDGRKLLEAIKAMGNS